MIDDLPLHTAIVYNTHLIDVRFVGYGREVNHLAILRIEPVHGVHFDDTHTFAIFVQQVRRYSNVWMQSDGSYYCHCVR